MAESKGMSRLNDLIGTNAANKLPAEIVGRFLQKLSVSDRLKSERVSPRWKRALQKWGWTAQRKFDRDIVFEGANERNNIIFFDNTSLDEGDCYLVLLLYRVAAWLRELDLHSFRIGNIERFIPKIAGLLQTYKNLEKLNIQGFSLHNFVDHLPSTLIDLKTSTLITNENLKTLSIRCPNLEEVPFHQLLHLDLERMVEFVVKFPRQKKLYFPNFPQTTKNPGSLASIGKLKELEVLMLYNFEDLDCESFEAIAEGCQRLHYLSFDARHLSEEALFRLAKIQDLKTLSICDRNGEFTDSVLKAIARRRKLERLRILGSVNENKRGLTDDSIAYLVARCKSLVSLLFLNCPQITERSLEAVVAEIQRRHGTSLRALPSGPFDKEIFYFYPGYNTGIEGHRARELIGNNPWLVFRHDPRQWI